MTSIEEQCSLTGDYYSPPAVADLGITVEAGFEHGIAATTGSLLYGHGSGRISSVMEAGSLQTSEES
ncbi:hypothetical protein R1flu_005348 [Riccia fluitans]|uniref:Uncharacterized protein n=1 Tax=Riccia fluitans TaxID=41844 RepID=A0ABD1YTW1_9MARC